MTRAASASAVFSSCKSISDRLLPWHPRTSHKQAACFKGGREAPGVYLSRNIHYWVESVVLAGLAAVVLAGRLRS